LVLTVFEWMQRCGMEPDSVSHSVAIRACARGAGWVDALRLLAEAGSRGLDVGTVSHSLTVFACDAVGQSRHGSNVLLGLLRGRQCARLGKTSPASTPAGPTYRSHQADHTLESSLLRWFGLLGRAPHIRFLRAVYTPLVQQLRFSVGSKDFPPHQGFASVPDLCAFGRDACEDLGTKVGNCCGASTSL